MTGDVTPDFSLSPSTLEFLQGMSTTKEIRVLTAEEAEPVLITSAYCNHAAIDVKVLEDGKSLTARFIPEKWSALSGDAVLSVGTSSEFEPVARIPVRVTARK